MIMPNLLSLVPSAHLRQHLRGLEPITEASLWQARTGYMHNFREDPNEFIPR